MLHLRGKVSLKASLKFHQKFFLKPNTSSQRLSTTCCTYCLTKRLQILHEAFLGFPMVSVLHVRKIDLSFANKKQLIRFKIYGIIAKSAQTDRRITTEGPSCTGQSNWEVFLFD